MKAALSTLLILHGFIHFWGFLMANNFVQSSGITLEMSRWEGAFWLAAAVLFALSLLLKWVDYPLWPVVVFIGVILSQILIIFSWKTAWAGTLVNGCILLLSVVYFGQQEFRSMVNQESQRLSAEVAEDIDGTIGEEDLSQLPLPVSNWLRRSGVLGKQPIKKVRLTQALRMKLRQDQSAWSEGKAEQLMLSSPPAFHWSVEVKLNPVLGFMGRDKWQEGKGHMLIKLLGLVPVVNETPNPRINEAALQRYLAEIVWCPTMALSTHLTWTPIDDRAALAVFTHEGVRGEGVFRFDEHYDFHQFTAMRYRETAEGAERIPWTVSSDKTEWRNGIRIPTKCSASWQIEGKEWTWLELEVGKYHFR
jgi:hypothetical protein